MDAAAGPGVGLGVGGRRFGGVSRVHNSDGAPPAAGTASPGE